MIALKLVFQSFAGVGSVLVCAGGGYYVMKEGHEENFYLVSSETGISSSNTPSLELWTAKTTTKPISTGTSVKTILTALTPTTETKTQQNYKCEAGSGAEKKDDESCILYSLKTDATTKRIEMSAIQTFIKDTNKESTLVTKTLLKAEITASKFFLLKAYKKLHTTWAFDESKTIILRTKDSETLTTEKTYATFKVHAKVSSTKVTGKTSWIIAQAKSAPVSTTVATISTPTYTCNFKGVTTLNKCSLTSLTNYENTTPFNFSSLTINSPQTTTLTTEANKYYLIKFVDTKPFHFTDTTKKEITFIDSQNGNTAKTTTLTFEAALFVLPSTSPTTLTEAIVIK